MNYSFSILRLPISTSFCKQLSQNVDEKAGTIMCELTLPSLLVITIILKMSALEA